MIQANELRIGNFVKYRWAIIKVDSIDRCGINLKSVYNKYACQDQVTSRVKIKDIKPIPLTEEWLLKFGFTKLWHMNKFQYSMYIYKSLNIEVQFFDERLLLELACTNDNDDLNFDVAYFTTMMEVKCNFVHQLQNLYYSLTGQELTIK